ncbi:hypothetical protein J2X42_004129 [Arthrobacter sp. BE255]|nr:hypothetical protein [Arthrobacter sp. BE255]
MIEFVLAPMRTPHVRHSLGDVLNSDQGASLTSLLHQLLKSGQKTVVVVKLAGPLYASLDRVGSTGSLT